MHKPAAVVFYARDFLSIEFPRLGAALSGYARVYIVVSEAERRNIEQLDPQGAVVDLSSFPPGSSATAASVDCGYNNDRYLRGYGAAEITAIVRSVIAACDFILERYAVEFYLDEPVSGFPNLHFNRQFAVAGARCLHFQTSWLPNYMFFTSDAAHAAVLPLRMLEHGQQLVHQHVEERLLGGALPLYVLNYGSRTARIRDAFLTLAKAVYRKLFRAQRYYLDRDLNAHLFHVSALLGSFRGGYLGPSQLQNLSGKYVLYPLHYEPESILNYFSDYSRQEEIAEQLLDALPLGYELILKEHPSQPGALNTAKWRTVTSNRRVLKVRGDVSARALLRYDVAVVSIGSTLAIEAALAGRPVGVLGHVHFSSMPGITQLSSPREIAHVLQAPRAERAEIERWYGEFLDANCFRGNIMKGRTTAIDLLQILVRLQAPPAGGRS